MSFAMGRRRSFPIRVTAVGASWGGSDIIIEELIGGVPGAASLYGNTNSPFGPNADTGTAKQVGTLSPGGPDLLIEYPVEFLRARTDANLTGTVDICGAETLE